MDVRSEKKKQEVNEENVYYSLPKQQKHTVGNGLKNLETMMAQSQKSTHRKQELSASKIEKNQNQSEYSNKKMDLLQIQ